MKTDGWRQSTSVLSDTSYFNSIGTFCTFTVDRIPDDRYNYRWNILLSGGDYQKASFGESDFMKPLTERLEVASQGCYMCLLIWILQRQTWRPKWSQQRAAMFTRRNNPASKLSTCQTDDQMFDLVEFQSESHVYLWSLKDLNTLWSFWVFWCKLWKWIIKSQSAASIKTNKANKQKYLHRNTFS